MTKLVNQPSAWPTRKLWAVIIAGMAVSGIRAALSVLWPDHPFEPFLVELGPWIQTGVMALAGYMTRNEAVPTDLNIPDRPTKATRTKAPKR